MKTEILLFSASWCNPCQNLKKQLASQGLSSNITFVDIDEQPELAKQHGIRSIPTTIMITDGVVSARISGSQQLEQIKKAVT